MPRRKELPAQVPKQRIEVRVLDWPQELPEMLLAMAGKVVVFTEDDVEFVVHVPSCEQGAERKQQ